MKKSDATRLKLPTAADLARGRDPAWNEHWYDAEALAFDPATDEIELTLVNRVRVIVPREMVPTLAELPLSAAKRMRLGILGGAIEVRSHDVDVSVRGMISRVVGASMGRRGGAVRSPVKAAAARANGRLGGRPRKEPTDTDVTKRRAKKTERKNSRSGPNTKKKEAVVPA
jgi:hypothetical protein